MPPPLRVLAIGDLEHDEFSRAVELIEQDAIVELTRHAEASEEPSPFELLVAFQSRPSNIDPTLIDGLRARMPLAGMAVVLGSWCEGEMRTGAPLPHCERVFWYQFAPWWQTVRAAWIENRPAHWQLAPGDDRPITRPASPKLIAIDTADHDSAHALLDACETLGMAGAWSPRHDRRPLTTHASAGVWVGAQLDKVEEQQLASFRQSLPEHTPLVVLLDFPRRDRVERALELGATEVLGKPWRVEQLGAAVLGDVLA
ncbi:hypothetical protein [Aeoliella sp. SH292]|uniref:hypothetical protein n=1 Tax=Aeoliella sp. SH292 TaxID=3454464 RepID=UPI003F95940E